MAESDASARQRISFAYGEDFAEARQSCLSLYSAFHDKHTRPETIIAQLGLLVRQFASFGIPVVDAELSDLGEAISLVRLKVTALSGEPPEVDL
jgi:hypothetical protein